MPRDNGSTVARVASAIPADLECDGVSEIPLQARCLDVGTPSSPGLIDMDSRWSVNQSKRVGYPDRSKLCQILPGKARAMSRGEVSAVEWIPI